MPAAEILAMVSQLIQLGMAIAPEIQQGVNMVMRKSGSSDPLTADEQATIDKGLDAAHAALQSTQQGTG